MKELPWIDFSTFTSQLLTLREPIDNGTFLFRGQTCSKPLLPKIARKAPKVDTSNIERRMLSELRRQGRRFSELSGSADLDLLAIAQHHGMATRLLDWSSNPFVALWFACSEFATPESGHLYIYRAAEDTVIDANTDADPFSYAITRIFQPSHNNARVIAQSGWFSVHPFYALLEFKGLDSDVIHFLWVWHLEIPAAEKGAILGKLDMLGVNQRFLFPDLDGLCKHLNWQMTS